MFKTRSVRRRGFLSFPMEGSYLVRSQQYLTIFMHFAYLERKSTKENIAFFVFRKVSENGDKQFGTLKSQINLHELVQCTHQQQSQKCNRSVVAWLPGFQPSKGNALQLLLKTSNQGQLPSDEQTSTQVTSFDAIEQSKENQSPKICFFPHFIHRSIKDDKVGLLTLESSFYQSVGTEGGDHFSEERHLTECKNGPQKYPGLSPLTLLQVLDRRALYKEYCNNLQGKKTVNCCAKSNYFFGFLPVLHDTNIFWMSPGSAHAQSKRRLFSTTMFQLLHLAQHYCFFSGMTKCAPGLHGCIWDSLSATSSYSLIKSPMGILPMSHWPNFQNPFFSSHNQSKL